MTRHEKCRSIKRYSLIPSLDQPVVSPTISTAIYQCSMSVSHHRLHNTTHPAAAAAFANEQAESNLQKSYPV